MRQAAHNIRLPGWLWSLVLAAEAINRVSSYMTRPPVDNGLTPVVDDVHYLTWSIVLTIGAGLIIVGVTCWLAGADWAPWLVALGHVVAFLCVSTFATSVALTAVFMGEPWSGFGPLFVVALLHCERALCAGTNIGRT